MTLEVSGIAPYTLDTIMEYYPDAEEVMLSERVPAYAVRHGREVILNNGYYSVIEDCESVSDAQERMHQFASDVF